VDDDPTLQGRQLRGLPVHSLGDLAGFCESLDLHFIFLALPSVTHQRRREILEQLRPLHLGVKILPTLDQLLDGKDSFSALQEIQIADLLGRDEISPDSSLMQKDVGSKTVLLTGAGGSIGSELCREILGLQPSKLILLEQHEHALYQLERELSPQFSATELLPCLGSVLETTRLAKLMKEHQVQTVYHAAAYKHVPLVEMNPLEGFRNNVLGTQSLLEACQAHQPESFVLISTDKAVRPTNIMGATKRMAELVIQDLQTRSTSTKFSMVRFGNVLGSSGSVLPLFEQQIRRGGPVTVTHPDVTRFFMTIPEAARLVLLAGAYATGGDVFVLDMGKPMKILDIARRMIELSGRSVVEDGIGDIEIAITGLRPGEKLYEELLIDDASLRSTPHSKILRAEEALLSQIEIASMLREVNKALKSCDAAALRTLIESRVDGYHQQETVAL